MSANLPHGVSLVRLSAHRDRRGILTELYRQSWLGLNPPPQWNLVISEPNVLRGVHVHCRHWDYLMLAHGEALFGLCDLRVDSPTFKQSVMVRMSADSPAALYIPPGVAHGFYFSKRATHVYAVSEYWDVADELGCRFDDPELGLQWPTRDPILSERDAELPTLAELMREFDARYRPAEVPQAAERRAHGDASGM